MKQLNLSKSDIDNQWLLSIAKQIGRNETTIAEAAKNAVFNKNTNTYTIKISHNTLSQILREQNLINYEIGRKGKTTDEEIAEEIAEEILTINQELQCGITKMWCYCNKQNVFGRKIPRHLIEKVYHNYIIDRSKEPKQKNPKPRCRYNAKEVNTIWHADIHYLFCNGERKYLYALIDDNSRFIVHYAIVDDKSCATIANEFQKACHYSKWGPPLVYWSDNGGENIGPEIRVIFNRHKIQLIRTLPANPQSNGKIERWWQGVEARIKGAQSWEEVAARIKQFKVYKCI